MTFDEIKEKIAIALNHKCNENWANILDDTTPGHYGFWDLEFDIALKDIWVEIQKRTFTFQNASLSFTAQLGSSNPDDGIEMPTTRTVSGAGKFEFSDNGEIEVLEFKINEQIDFFEEEHRPLRPRFRITA